MYPPSTSIDHQNLPLYFSRAYMRRVHLPNSASPPPLPCALLRQMSLPFFEEDSNIYLIFNPQCRRTATSSHIDGGHPHRPRQRTVPIGDGDNTGDGRSRTSPSQSDGSAALFQDWSQTFPAADIINLGSPTLRAKCANVFYLSPFIKFVFTSVNYIFPRQVAQILGRLRFCFSPTVMAENSAQAFALLKEFEDVVTGINATKYLTVASFVVLLYDHFILFDQEVELVWKARWSYIKFLFILNRYLVPACLLIINMELSGLLGFRFNDFFCKFWLATSGFLAIISLGMGNAFIIYRLYVLWSFNKTVLNVLVVAFVLTYSVTISMMGLAAYEFIPVIEWSPIVQTCTITQKPKAFVIVWAAPIVFDVFIFIMTCWNALSRPRDSHTAVTLSLYRDGILYFSMLTVCRIFNISLISSAPLPLMQLGLYAAWAFMTCIINRLLIQHRKSNVAQLFVSYGEPSSNGHEEPEWTSYIEMDSKLPRMSSSRNMR